MACCLVQFPELPPPNLFCVENAIEGDYVKYNSNSGFVNVADVQLRNTPQAFSHFSFEHSAGAALVVDIQVGRPPPSAAARRFRCALHARTTPPDTRTALSATTRPRADPVKPACMYERCAVEQGPGGGFRAACCVPRECPTGGRGWVFMLIGDACLQCMVCRV